MASQPSNQDQGGSSEDQEGSNSNSMEIIIRRVGMEDHINIVKLFQVKDKLSKIIIRVPAYVFCV